MATKRAGKKIYGQARPNEGTLEGKRGSCVNMTLATSVNPVTHEARRSYVYRLRARYMEHGFGSSGIGV